MQFSFEFFPPADDLRRHKLKPIIREYADLSPLYFSMTYGAGGSDPSNEKLKQSLLTIEYMRSQGVAVVAHLPHSGRTRKDTMSLLNCFRAAGAEMVLALRGDAPKGNGYYPHPGGFSYTSHFIAEIKNHHSDMIVMAAGYPEKHPESASVREDIENMKSKIEAGASVILEQFCFDSSVVSAWHKKVRADYAISTKLVPGIIGMLNYERICRRAREYNTHIPSRIHEMFAGLHKDTNDYKERASSLLEAQIEDLAAAGEHHVHVYALNSPEFPKAIRRLTQRAKLAA